MDLPSEVPVMTLPNVLFPQALLPLYIFEPRYRQMLADSLKSSRMFSVAMQKPGYTRETPCQIAGLGLIRVSVAHEDGTSHLILQGLTRVELVSTIQTKPYRIQAIRPLTTPTLDSVVIDALVAKLLELVAIRLRQGFSPFPFPLADKLPGVKGKKKGSQAAFSADELLQYISNLPDPDQISDMVSCALLPDPSQRQTILESVDLETRLKTLIHFLMAEIQAHGKDGSHES